MYCSKLSEGYYYWPSLKPAMVMATLATMSTKALYLKLLVIIHVTKIVVYIKEPTGGPCQPTVASLVYMPKLVSSFHSSRTSCLIAPPYCDSKSFIKSREI